MVKIALSKGPRPQWIAWQTLLGNLEAPYLGHCLLARPIPYAATDGTLLARNLFPCTTVEARVGSVEAPVKTQLDSSRVFS